MRKMELFKRRMRDGVADMFPNLTEFLHTSNLSVAIVRGSHLSPHCTGRALQLILLRCEYRCMRCGIPSPPLQQVALLVRRGVNRNKTLMARGIFHFWHSLSHQYTELTAEAMRILLPFPTTYLCESSFSTLTAMKTKYRARLNVESNLPVIHPSKNG